MVKKSRYMSKIYGLSARGKIVILYTEHKTIKTVRCLPVIKGGNHVQNNKTGFFEGFDSGSSYRCVRNDSSGRFRLCGGGKRRSIRPESKSGGLLTYRRYNERGVAFGGQAFGQCGNN